MKKIEINKEHEDFIFQSLASCSNDYFYIWDLKKDEYRVSENMSEDFDLTTKGNGFISAWGAHVHERDRDRVRAYFFRLMNDKKGKISIEYQVSNKDGVYVWINNRAIMKLDENGELELIVGSLHNIEFDGTVDSVTGLLHQEKCKEMFDLIQNNKMQSQGSIMLLGVDDFSSINTLNNHKFGDLVLRTTVQDILNILPDHAIMYRYDGDQFLIVAENIDKKEMIALYEAIKKYTLKTHIVNSKSYRFTVSAGIAAYPEDGNNWLDIEKAVTVALKKAKEAGKNRYVEFTQETLQEKIHEQSLSRYLADSVDNNFEGFSTVFQPVCATKSLDVLGAEILLRYTTPDGLKVTPDEFIPLLEQSHLIIPVGMWVMEKAIQTCKQWITYNEDFVMNVNVSYVQLRDHNFCNDLESLLFKYHLDIKHIVLELTESYFISDAPNINNALKRLEELHFRIAMDDFGTGYSSLARLSQFNVDVVKIDRSFVQLIHRSQFNYDFIDAVVHLCHNVGMSVCVEGVETREEQTSICMLNVDYIQGFYVSKPIDADKFLNTFLLEPKANEDLVVTPDKKMRLQQLTKDKDVLLEMMEATPLALMIWDINYEVVACNKEVLKLFEVEDSEYFKANFYNFSPKFQEDGCLSYDYVIAQLKEAFVSGSSSLNEYEHITMNGESIPVEVILKRIPYMSDYVVVSYTRDLRKELSDRKKNEMYQKRLQAIIDTTPLSLNLWNEKHENIMCNKEIDKLFGIEGNVEYMRNFKRFSPKYQPDGMESNEKAEQYIDQAFETGYVQFDWMHYDVNKNLIPTEVTLVKIDYQDEEGELVAGYIRDMRKQIASGKEDKEVMTRLRAITNSMPLSCIMWSKDFEMIDCNDVSIAILEAKNKQELMEHFDYFLPLFQPDGQLSINKKKIMFEEAIREGYASFEWVYQNRSNENIPCEITLVKIPSEDDFMVVGYSRDLRELHRTLELKDRLEKIAFYDTLTGSVSVTKFMEELQNNFADTTEEELAVIVFDVDHFKDINEIHGREAGDLVLKEVVRVIMENMPETAMLGRYGGDEFLIQMKDYDLKALKTWMKELIDLVGSQVITYDGKAIDVSISMGATLKKSDDRNYQALLNRGDKALERAKNKECDRYHIV